MNSLKELSDIVEMMKGELSISFDHYNGWNASMYNKAKTKYWDAQFIRHELDRCDGFSSYEDATDALLTIYNAGKFVVRDETI